jgi:ABC-2 type transport system permease protein
MSAPPSVVTGQGSLIPVTTEGWRSGFENLFRKEMGQWWGTKMWWIQTLIWVVILNGVTTAIMLDSSGMPADDLRREAVQTFMLVAATAIGIGIVLTLQGSVVGEKESGTAAWVMSKPASRVSYVLSKLAANYIGFVVTALLIPSVIFILEARALLESPVSLSSFASGLAVLALELLFYVVLTISLGCVFKSRGPIASIGIGLILTGQFFKGMLPLPLVQVMPWLLGDVASAFAINATLEWNPVIPIVAVSVATVALAFLGVWRFGREEF